MCTNMIGSFYKLFGDPPNFFWCLPTIWALTLIPIGGVEIQTNLSATTHAPTTSSSGEELPDGDFTWILICGFIIFTMQTGFGLLEGGIVSQKNETNIMLKNVADVVLGGFTYWLFGYGITYGTWWGSTPYFGIGDYVVDSPDIGPMGELFTSFFFQLSFATTATTITSGAMAERCNFKAYCLYSLFATITYSVQARWVWGPSGFLGCMGVVDIAGSGSVHLVGGTAAFVSAWMLGPRLGRYDFNSEAPPPGNHMNILLGLFNLWWGWFSFNAGSTYGVTSDKWKFAARAAVSTVVASIGGGLVGILWGFLKRRKPFNVVDMVNAVLGALVGITAGCALFHTPEALLTGAIGALVALLAAYIPDKLKIDDPVGATAVHGFGGIWGMLAVGFFADDDEGILGVTKGQAGLIRGGSGYLLLVQTIAVACIMAWSFTSTVVILWLINLVIRLRVTPHEEMLGLDFCEHGIRRRQIGVTPALSLFGSLADVRRLEQSCDISGADNPAHIKIAAGLLDIRREKAKRLGPTKKMATTPYIGGHAQVMEKRKKRKKLKTMALVARASQRIKHATKVHINNRIDPADDLINYLDMELGKLDFGKY